MNRSTIGRRFEVIRWTITSPAANSWNNSAWALPPAWACLCGGPRRIAATTTVQRAYLIFSGHRIGEGRLDSEGSAHHPVRGSGGVPDGNRVWTWRQRD